MTAGVRKLLVAVPLLATVACSWEKSEPASEFEPDEASSADVRIVSLVPAATSVLMAIGATDALVGRTTFDDAPELADLPSVGGGIDPSAEALITIDPDLVVYFQSSADPSVPRLLERLGIEGLPVNPERIEGISTMIGELGQVTGKAGEAEALIDRHQKTLDDIESAVVGRTKVRAAFVMAGDTPWVAGSETYLGELIEVGGGTNIFADIARPYAPVNPEAIVTRTPQVILVAGEVELDPRLVAGARVAVLPERITIPGPGLDSTAIAIADALHPGAIR